MSSTRSLAKRWDTDEGEIRAERAFDALASGRSLDDAAWGEVDGRLDLRGLRAPLPQASPLGREVEGLIVEELSETLTVRDASLVSLDLSGARLEGLRIFDSTVANCVFDAARCQDWRIWGSHIRDSRFVGTDLRRSAIGPWHAGRGNIYERVNFTRADLRQISCPAATFVDCDFSNARLERVDFQSSGFVRVRFAGELREVIFWDRGLNIGKPETNPMKDVDFTDARFKGVEFRRLNLESVTFPTSDGHLVISNYPCVIERALETLRGDNSLTARLLRATFEIREKWIGPKQNVGVFSLADFDEPGEAEFAQTLLLELERDCAGSSR